MNYLKVCLQCGDTFLSSKHSVSFCCTEHRSLYQQRISDWQKLNAFIQEEREMRKIKERQRSEEEKVESSLSLTCGNEVFRWGRLYDMSDDDNIIYLERRKNDARQELIWIENKPLQLLKKGLGVHSLTDRDGANLYYVGDSEYTLKSRLYFVNLCKRRREEWVFSAGNIVCCYYSPFELCDGVYDYLEFKRRHGVEREKKHLMWALAAERQDQNNEEDLEFNEALLYAGVVQRIPVSLDFNYIINCLPGVLDNYILALKGEGKAAVDTNSLQLLIDRLNILLKLDNEGKVK